VNKQEKLELFRNMLQSNINELNELENFYYDNEKYYSIPNSVRYAIVKSLEDKSKSIGFYLSKIGESVNAN
jgi:hypothetical protein